MNMQTGPAPGQTLERWLLWTGVIEIANTGIFSLLWWVLNRAIPGSNDVLSLAGLMMCNLVLLVGGGYWLLKRGGFFVRTPAPLRLRLLRAAYVLTGLALLVFPALVIARLVAGVPVEWGDALLGAAFWLFGAGEFVHYFVFKINMRRYERRASAQHRRRVPARLRRELHRAAAQARSEARAAE